MPRTKKSLKRIKSSTSNWFPQPPFLAPSILSADFAELKKAVRRVERARCRWLHLDVMDGHFVPNMTFGAVPIRSMRAVSPALFFDTHIMVEAPEQFVPMMAESGADLITFHQEAAPDRVESVLRLIRKHGKRAGISIKPRTALRHILPYLDKVDLVLIMTVEPGFGGQALIPRCLNKVRELHLLRRKEGFKYLIEVDGGINAKTTPLAVSAGADALVAGNAVFGGDGDVAANIRALNAAMITSD